MASIEARGYVNSPKTIQGGKGPFSVFTLAEKQKQKDGTYTKVYYDVVDFNHAEPPPESSYATVTGWFSVKNYKSKDQTEKQGLAINCQKLEIAPPREGGSTPNTQTADPFSDLPF